MRTLLTPSLQMELTKLAYQIQDDYEAAGVVLTFEKAVRKAHDMFVITGNELEEYFHDNRD